MNDSRRQELIEAHLENRLSVPEAAELSALLVNSAAARRFFWEHASIHGLLQPAVQREWLGRAQPGQFAQPGPASADSRTRWTAAHWQWSGLAAAAALALGLGLAWSSPRLGAWLVSSSADATDPEPRTRGVATVARMAGVEWTGGTPSPAVGAVLAPGWLRFNAGLVQLEFFSGASVIVEGPAEFEIRSESEAYCRVGRFSATVPEPARGFKVSSPSLALVDLGTAFGMEVSRNGAGEVFVYKGLVRLTRTGTREVRRDIQAGQGVRVDGAGQWQPMTAPGASFATASELATRQQSESRLRLAQWRESDRNLNRDPSLLVRFDFEARGGDERVVPNLAPGPGGAVAGTLIGCQWSEGRWPGKGALEFKGVGDRVRLVVPGEMTALTFSAWVRADSLSHRYNALLVSDSYRRGMLRWQLTQQGELALTQLLVDDQGLADPASTQRVVSRPLIPLERLGLWVHVASVADFRTGLVEHYIDGQPAGSGKLGNAVPGQLGSVELGNWGVTPETERGRRLAGGRYLDRSFVGKIDEFALFSRALPAEEIQRQFLDGRVDTTNP